MTSIFIILIVFLSTILVLALYTLKRRKQTIGRPVVVTQTRRRSKKVFSSAGPTTQLSTTSSDELMLANIFNPPPTPNIERGTQCGECSRLFDERSDYCYFDGSMLNARLPSSKTFWVCTTCGHEGESSCDCAEGIFRVQSAIGPASVPMIPVARCPTCQDLGVIGSMCEIDNVQRVPVFEMNFRAFPPKGFGPRRSVCLHCGSQFSASAKYCSSDGHRLSLLN